MRCAQRRAATPVLVIARGDTAVRDVARRRSDLRRAGGAARHRGCAAQRPGVARAIRDPSSSSHGDAPLIRPETLQRLLAAHASSPRACTLLLGSPGGPVGHGQGRPRRRRPRPAHRRGGRSRARASPSRWNAMPASTCSTGPSSGPPSTGSRPPTPRASTTSPTSSPCSPDPSRAWSCAIPTRSSGSTTAVIWPPPRRCSAAGPSTH